MCIRDTGQSAPIPLPLSSKTSTTRSRGSTIQYCRAPAASPRREVFGRLADEIVGSIRGQHLDHDRRYVVTTSPAGALLSTVRLLYPCGLTRSGSPVSSGRKLALARNQLPERSPSANPRPWNHLLSGVH